MGRSDELDWNDFRHLLAAARAGSLAGAARTLGVEHSTVGRRLRALERALGGPLVYRNPDGLTLTPLGERVAAAAQEVERAVAAVHDAAGPVQARVKLALPSGFSQFFTAHLRRLRDADPPISLELVSGARPVDLAKGEADLAVRSGPVSNPELVARRLCEVGWSLYAARGYLARHPLHADPTDLRGHDVIGYDEALADTPAARWIATRADAASIVMRSREMVDMVDASAAGAGLALLPCHLAAASPELVRLTPEVLVVRDLWLVYRREARLSPAVQAAIRFTIEVIEQARTALLGNPAG